MPNQNVRTDLLNSVYQELDEAKLNELKIKFENEFPNEARMIGEIASLIGVLIGLSKKSLRFKNMMGELLMPCDKIPFRLSKASYISNPINFYKNYPFYFSILRQLANILSESNFTPRTQSQTQNQELTFQIEESIAQKISDVVPLLNHLINWAKPQQTGYGEGLDSSASRMGAIWVGNGGRTTTYRQPRD